MTLINRAADRNTWRIYPADCIEPVTFGSRQVVAGSDSSFLSYALPRARRGKLEKTFADGKAVDRITWQVWQESLDNAVPVANPPAPPPPLPAPFPKKGDRITDGAGLIWLIDTVESKLFADGWDCTCLGQVPVSPKAVGA